MKYKIGDWIVFTDKEGSKRWKEFHGISLYGKIGKITDIDKSEIPYIIEFKEFIDDYNGYYSYYGKGKDSHCRRCHKNQISLYKDFYKLKKLLQN